MCCALCTEIASISPCLLHETTCQAPAQLWGGKDEMSESLIPISDVRVWALLSQAIFASKHSVHLKVTLKAIDLPSNRLSNENTKINVEDNKETELEREDLAFIFAHYKKPTSFLRSLRLSF